MSVTSIYGGSYSGGVLVYSNNQGVSFNDSTGTESGQVWRTVASSTNGYYLGAIDRNSSGIVYRSVGNGGSNWSTVTIPSMGIPLWLNISTTGQYWVIMTNGEIFVSRNYGDTGSWSSIDYSTKAPYGNQTFISTDGNTIVFTCYGFTEAFIGYIYKIKFISEEYVIDGVATATVEGTTISTMTMLPDASKIYYGEGSILYIISNAETQLKDFNSSAIYAISTSDTGDKIVVVTSNNIDINIYNSIDGGASWTDPKDVYVISDTLYFFNSIASSADGTQIVIGTNDKIYLSVNSGSTWTPTGSETDSWTTVALSQTSGICFEGSSQVLVFTNGYEYKEIKDVKRGDLIITDIPTNSMSKVSKVVENYLFGKFVKIPKNLLNNSQDIICTRSHPVWIGSNRVLAKNIEGVEFVKMSSYFYNIQFDDESTYYVDNLKVDSLSPSHHRYKLPEHLFWDKTKYNPDTLVFSEDDVNRNKPLMIDCYTPKCVLITSTY